MNDVKYFGVKPFGVIKVEGRLTDQQYDRLKHDAEALKSATNLPHVVILEEGTDLTVEPNIGVWQPDAPTKEGWYPVWIPDRDEKFVVRVEISEVEGDPDDVRHYWESTPDLKSHEMVGMMWDHRPVQFPAIPEEIG